MHIVRILIGDHQLMISTADTFVHDWVTTQFRTVSREDWDKQYPDLFIHIQPGYGTPLEDYEVSIYRERQIIRYTRNDFCFEIDEGYRDARLQVHDELALKHSLMTIYSAHIVHNKWGLLIHSSCVVEDDKAYLFAGQSGAGKSTVARLSSPREVLSDEATLLRIDRQGVTAYDSPFRSDSISSYDKSSRPLAGIHLLEQSPDIERSQIPATETVMRLMNKVFYWAHDPAETIKVLTMCRMLAQQVNGYRLKFQKNDLFWERISACGNA